MLGLTRWDLFWLALWYVAMWALGLGIGDWLQRKYGKPHGPGGAENWYGPGPFSDDSGGGLPVPVDSNKG